MPGNCFFNELWLVDPRFKDWIKRHPSDNHKALCSVCQTKPINISTMGTAALTSHISGHRHKEKTKAASESRSSNLKHFFRRTSNQSTGENPDVLESQPVEPQQTSVVSARNLDSFVSRDDVFKAELWWIMKSVNNAYSFKSNEDISFVLQKMFPQNPVAEKFSCGETKSMYLTCYGLAPHFKKLLLDKIRHETYVLMFDESMNYHLQMKQMDLWVRFWDHDRVVSRYLDSQFIGHAKATDLLESCSDSIESSIGYQNVIQISMDGPNVNWSFYSKFEENLTSSSNTKLLNCGSCGLHILNNSFKKGCANSEWGIGEFLTSLHRLFKESPARREDYQKLSHSDTFPLKYCSHRWLENVPVAERSIEMLPNLKKFVAAVTSKAIPDPKTKSYETVAQGIRDDLLLAKLNAFISISRPITKFLTVFQTDKPMIAFLSQHLEKLLRTLLKRFIKASVLDEACTPYKLLQIDVNNASNHKAYTKIDTGFIAQKKVRDLLQGKKISDRQALEFQRQCKDFLIAVVKHMMEKSPLKFSLIRCLSCLDPHSVSNKDSCHSKMTKIITQMSAANLVQASECDELLLQYDNFLAEKQGDNTFKQFNKESPDSRLDTLYFDAMNAAPDYQKLWNLVIKKLLILSHGQASVERGFSVNKEVDAVNLKGARLIARRIVKDHILSVGGLKKVIISKEMLMSARGARQKYVLELQQNKEKQLTEEQTKKRKRVLDDLEEVKNKKRQLEADIEALSNSSNQYADKAELQSNLTLLAKANSMRKSADNKQKELKKIQKMLEEKVTELRNM